MKSPLKWPGGKGPLASWIVSLMPPHIHYVEPYFGAGAVLFAKDPEGVSEVVNDLNGELMNFWRVLQNETTDSQFQRLAQVSPVSEERWDDIAEWLPYKFSGREYHVGRAVAFFIRVRQSLAARGKCFTALSRTRTRRGMNEQAAAWLTAVDGLPTVHERLRRVVILCKPALEVILQQDGPATLFYLDPPYLPETRCNGGGEYGELEMTWGQHADLLAVIQEVQGKVLLSGYRSELYDTRLRHWNRREKVVANHASHTAVKGKEIECVWTNF